MTSCCRRIALLAANQALALSAVVLSMALAGMPGAVLVPDKDLAVLPITAMVFRPVLLWPNP